MRVLLTGSTGVLGAAFARRLGDAAIMPSRSKLQVTDFARVVRLVADAKPDVLVNCAAHVDVESAESDPDPAFAANVLLPGLLATACRHAGARMVHFSSTGCYGDWKHDPFTEYDVLKPTTVHHQTKAKGECAVRDSGCDHLILRTGWLFGSGSGQKKNFVWRRILEAQSRPTMLSDTTQRGNPTYVDDVVEQTLALLQEGVAGTYNCVSPDPVTRHTYVEAILSIAGSSCRLEPGGPFKRLAPVSPNETAVNYALSLLGLDRMPSWRSSLEAYMQEVRHWPEWRALSITESGA